MSDLNGARPSYAPRALTREMEEAYLDYAMSVLVSRALPDVRDGLKPVHRRILYAMYRDLRLFSTGPYKKSARIVGEVLGKYHPHSDQAVYDAMVRLAQDFSVRYPLVDGQGNFGSIDGDNPASIRYTEARLASIAHLTVADLDKDTVAWNANFDDSLKEPAVLPTVLPNLLVNGANGIAVGMATQIPPHNLGEVCDALCFLLDRYARKDEIGTAELLAYIKGPDFPTGGRLYRYAAAGKAREDRLLDGYARGRGSFAVQAKMHEEAMGMGRTRLVVTQIPYLTNKAHLIERIAHLAQRGQLPGIADLRDESDRAGMRICLELSRAHSAPPQKRQLLDRLFRLTPLQQNFSLSLVALVDGAPIRVNLKEILERFLRHRLDVVRRRTAFDLAAAQARLHIVEGLLQALDMLDAVIQTIRQSRRPETARKNLMKAFDFSPEQAQAILDMPLRQLVALEIRQLRDEFRALIRQVQALEALLASEERMRAVIQEELQQVKAEYGDERRTRIMEQEVRPLSEEDLEPDQTVWISVGRQGTVKRYAYRGMRAGRFKEIGRNGSLATVAANTRDMLYLFSADGKCQRVQIFRVPHAGSPKHVADLTAFSRRDAIVAAIPLPRDSRHDLSGHLTFVTRQGVVKRIQVNRLIEAPGEELKVITLKKGDRLGWVLLSDGDQEVMLFTARGKAIRFREADIRSMSLGAAGVRGPQFDADDAMVAAVLAQATSAVLSVTEKGFIKRTPIAEYPLRKRTGKGVANHKLSAKTGTIVGAVALNLQDDKAKVTLQAGRSHIVLDALSIPESRRTAAGRPVPAWQPAEAVDAITLIWSDAEEEKTRADVPE